MATIGKLVMGIFLNSKQAETGLDKVREKVSKTASLVSKAGKTSGNWFADLTKSYGLVAGAATGIVATLTGATTVLAGGRMETAAVKMSALSGSWAEGVTQLSTLRDISKSTGATLESLIDSTKAIRGAGISSGSAVSLLESVAGAGEILGGGATGIKKAGAAMADLLEGGTATEGVLKGLNDEGLPVFKALASELTRVTGQAYSARDAISALRRGTVSSFTGVVAIQNATKTPEAQQAADRFANSFEGQKSRLVSVMNDVMGTVGRGLIEAIGINRIMAFSRGFVQQVGTMAESLLSKLGFFADPKNLKGALDEAFDSGRENAIFMGKVLTRAGIGIAEAVGAVGEDISNVCTAILSRAKDLQGIMDPGWLKDSQFFLAGSMAVLDPTNFGSKRDTIKQIGRDWAEERANRGNLDDFGNNLKAKRGGGNQFTKMREDAAKFFDSLGSSVGGMAAEILEMAEAEMDRLEGGMAHQVRMMADAEMVRLEGIRKLNEGMAAQLAQSEAFVKTTNDWTRGAFEGVSSPLEKFQKTMWGTFEDFQQRRANLGMLGANDQAWYGEVLRRKQAQSIGDLLKEFSPGDSFIAQRADAGSAAATESIVRNRFSESNTDPQARLEAAVKRGTIMQERTAEYQRRLLEAAERTKQIPIVKF